MTCDLEAICLSWLRYERRCFLVACERLPNSWSYRPDIIGVQLNRTFIEIEVKRTWSDYLANAKKREPWNYKPSQFYFACPSNLAQKIAEDLVQRDSLAGVIQPADGFGINSYTGLHFAAVTRKARLSPVATKVRVSDVARLVSCQSGTLCSAYCQLARK